MLDYFRYFNIMKNKKICVVGLGYVGLTLSVVLAEKFFKVYGVEVNKSVVDQLNNYNPHFLEKGLDVLLKRFLNKNLFISDQIPKDEISAFIVCVGTPIDKKTKMPVLDYIVRSVNDVANSISDGALVVLRSTVPVGTTRKIVKGILDKSGKRYSLAFCPERTAEGAALTELKQLPQVIGGIDEESVDRALDIFRKVTPTTIQVSSLEASEMVKLLDNTYRDVNFSYANEVALICEKLGLDALELIRSANMGYPRTAIPVPGFVGGACLEKDPYILADFSSKMGYVPHLTKYCRQINESIPNHIAKKIESGLEKLNKGKDSKIFITGMAFKGQPETDDLRGSPSIDLLDNLRQLRYNNIYIHDYVVSKEKLEKHGIEICSMEEGFAGADCAVIATNHTSYYREDIGHLSSIMNKPSLLFDIWRVFDQNIVKANGIIYSGVGIG